MMVWVWATMLGGCGLDDLQPTEQANVVNLAAEEPAEDAEAIPDHEPQMGEPIAEGGAREPDPTASPDAVPPEEWNPISVPQGPREGGGVRWQGVKRNPDDGPLPTPQELAEKYGHENVDPDQPWNRETVQRIINQNSR